MANTINLNAEVGANFIGDDTQPAITVDNASTGVALKVQKGTSSGNATIAPIELAAAGLASAPVLATTGGFGFASCTSVVLTTVANTDYALRVWVNGQPRWIPCFKDAAIIGAAAVA